MSTGGGRTPRAKRTFFIMLFKHLNRNAYWRGNGAQRAFLIFYFCKKEASSNVRMEAAMGNGGREAREHFSNKKCIRDGGGRQENISH